MLARLAIAALGGIAVIAVLVAVLAFLVSSGEQPGPRSADPGISEIFESWLRRRSAPRTDFERVEHGAIVPVDKAPDLLRQCSRSSVEPIEGYWRPTRAMVEDLENRLPAFLDEARGLQPLAVYARQYAGVLSEDRLLIYASFLSTVAAEDMGRDVIIQCDGGNSAWGIVFDIESKAFNELRVNGSYRP